MVTGVTDQVVRELYTALVLRCKMEIPSSKEFLSKLQPSRLFDLAPRQLWKGGTREET